MKMPRLIRTRQVIEDDCGYQLQCREESGCRIPDPVGNCSGILIAGVTEGFYFF